MFSFTHFLSVFFVAISAVQGAVVTFYYLPDYTSSTAGVSEERKGTTILHALPATDGGVTLYEVQDIASLIIDHRPNTTVTLLSTPTTATYTYEINASRQVLNVGPATPTGALRLSNIHNCTLDITKLEGDCVEEDIQETGTVNPGGKAKLQEVAATTSFSGALQPFITVTTSGCSSVLLEGGFTLISGMVSVVFVILTTCEIL